MSTPTGDIESFLLSDGDIPACVALAERCFEAFAGQPHLVGEWFERRVRRNPWQAQLPGIGVGLRERGRLIGFRAMFAQPWWLAGRSTIAAFAAHTAVDDAYRGRGLGSRLIADSRRFADLTGSTSAGDITQRAYASLGFLAVGGVDNDFHRCRASYVGSWRARLGPWLGQPVGQICDLALKLRRLESAPVGGHVLIDEGGCGEEFDRFWVQVRDGYGSCLQRDARFLQWRLFDAATHPLTLSALRDAQGRLKAWAVWGRQEYSRDVSAAVLRDVLCPAGDRATLALLLSLLLRRWRRAGFTWASLEVAMPWISEVFRSGGCEHVPSRGNRYHVHLASAVDPAVLGNWYRGALDGDYFDY